LKPPRSHGRLGGLRGRPGDRRIRVSRGGVSDPSWSHRAVPEVDTSAPHFARVYDYWLGGKDNFEVDRDVAEATLRIYPAVRTMARENRAFLRRAVAFLAEHGVRQFIDVGTGIPTAENTHEVAQRVAAASRVVYVDNDPLVLTHARALLTSSDEGATAYIDA